MVAWVCMGPWRWCRERRRYTHGFCKFPVAHLVHDLRQDFSWEIGGEDLSGTVLRWLQVVSIAPVSARIVFRRKMICMDIELGQT